MFNRRIRHTMFDPLRTVRATARYGLPMFESRLQHTLLSFAADTPGAYQETCSFERQLDCWTARYAVGHPPVGWRPPTMADVARLGMAETPGTGVA
jgi:hypothetical protein